MGLKIKEINILKVWQNYKKIRLILTTKWIKIKYVHNESIENTTHKYTQLVINAELQNIFILQNAHIKLLKTGQVVQGSGH